jgi:3-oxoadipate enol-lactonase
MRMLKANGVNLNVAVSGPEGGVAVVLAHSLGTDHRVWDGLLPHLPASVRAIRYDLRGHGVSDAPPALYSIADHVADLVAILDGLGVAAPVVIVGLSIGGMIALAFAAAHAGRTRAIVLADTGYRIGTKDIWNERIDTVRTKGIEALADGAVERAFSGAYRQAHPAEVAGWRNLISRTSVEGYVGSAYALRDTDLEKEARTIRVPTLVLCGSTDPTAPPELAHATAALIPGAKTVIVTGPAHLMPTEAPDEAGRLIGGFLRENGIV